MQLPEKFLERMRTMLGSEYEAFLRSYDDPPCTGIRVNPLKRTEAVSGFIKDLEPVPWCAEGFYTDKSIISGTHPYHIGGAFYFQEPSAMAAVSALPIEEGDFVLDLCAAPGGKATHAGAALNNTGLLMANEIVPRRAEILAENIERFGLRNAVVTNENPARLAEKYPEYFDKIIVDAPCSGEGMFRREPRAVTEWSPEHAGSCAARQRNILDSAVKLLKNGGLLLYSTCTFSEEENEDNVRYMLENHGMSLMNISLSGVTEGINMPEALRIFPHRSRGEGHFVALLRKNHGGIGINYEPKRDRAVDEAMKLYRKFENEALNIHLEGTPCLFGERLYLAHTDVDRIKTLRPGLFLGECKKNRFEPSHALALALSAEDFKSTLSPDDDELDKYLHGEVVDFDGKGYAAVIYGQLPIGWGKASGGVLKNHFPKKLRLK